MLKRQCTSCQPNVSHRSKYYKEFGIEIEETPLFGAVTGHKVNPCAKLPGLEGTFAVRIYTVQCSKCGHTWTYRKKIK